MFLYDKLIWVYPRYSKDNQGNEACKTNGGERIGMCKTTGKEINKFCVRLAFLTKKTNRIIFIYIFVNQPDFQGCMQKLERQEGNPHRRAKASCTTTVGQPKTERI